MIATQVEWNKGGILMDKGKKCYRVLLATGILLILVVFLFPFLKPIKVYNPLAGVYFEVHGTYAVAVDYTKEKVKIPSHCMFRPVTKTSTLDWLSDLKGRYIVEEIYIPDTVIEIEEDSFLAYRKLKTVTGGNNVKIIGNSAFLSTETLTDIPYFKNVKKIGEGAFEYCNISNLSLPQGIEEIGNTAFKGNSVSKLDINLNNIKTGYHCFRDNPFEKSLGGFIINSRGELQSYYENETIIVVPDNVKAIYGSFYHYGNGEEVEVYLPDSVEKITGDSFWFIGHGTVYIPASVKDIECFDDKEQFAFHNATIVTTPGSYAEEFAKKYNIDYEIVDEIEYPKIAE